MKTASFKDNMKARLESLRLAVSAFRDDIKGVAAIEFAFIAPLMLLLYVGTIEISGALSANRKLSRVSSTLGDLITQAECFTDPVLNDIIKIADDIMYPYSNTLKIRLSGVLVESGTAKVQWSRGYGMNPLAKGSIYTVPNKIKIDGNFLVAARIQTTYTPAVGWLATHKVGDLSKDTTAINMEEEMFLRPRIGNNIEVKGSCS